VPVRTPKASAAIKKESTEEFLARASPWVDLTLTSFWHEDRVGNFLNLGVQAGGYFFGRLRLSARFVMPLERTTDDISAVRTIALSDGSSVTVRRKARDMSALYGASVGLVVTNSRTFVFGPSVAFFRTDVSAYGNAVELLLPFEWTTRKNLRVAFEVAIGHAFGGTIEGCRYDFFSGSSCNSSSPDRTERAGGLAVLFQYSMGWSLGSL
jgi:hypothetical protein